MAASYPQLVLLGDSLFQFSVDLQDGFSFQAQLQSDCIRKLDVVNRGFSGWTSANALEYLPRIFPPASESSPKIECLLVLLGANDAVLPLPNTTQSIPIDTYKANLKAIITHPNITSHDPRILLITPPPLNQLHATESDLAKGLDRCIRDAHNSAKYSQVARDVAAEVPGVVLIDLWSAVMNRAIALTPDYVMEDGKPLLGTLEAGIGGGLKKLLTDGLHMSGEAYRVLYTEVIPHIAKDWNPDDRSAYVFPDWRCLKSKIKDS